ncbi:hypothetical protein AWZ03_012284 [Drosophila navojoa]|uniref:Serine palmitoyltransferase 1 n=1 Tax=Drosophila navojoa TaxID=7232 RepID=A0A484AXB0_DRONA|nr:hypothetical protein AWZ03_012284 [Drosophila navojoa]
MMGIQLFNELGSIFRNTPTYALVLETLLLITVIALLLHKRGGRGLSKEQQESLIEQYEPEPLVADTDPDHPLLHTRLVESRVGKRIVVNGHDCLNVGSHNYLGLLEDNEILEEACKCLRKYGVGSCGPRGFYGTMDVHLELEDRLAKFMGLEEAIVYSYGFSTVASAIPAYAKRGDIIYVDEAVNFAIQKGLDASRSTIVFFKHNDVQDLERSLQQQEKRDQQNPKKAQKTRRFLVVEGIYMNTGKLCPLPELVELRKKYKLRLFLDETVSFGTLGKTGRGITEHFNVNRLSGLGYIFSASLPPMLTQAAISALDRFEREPQIFGQLQERSRQVHTQFKLFTKLKLDGDELSPVKHLYLAESRESFEVESKLFSQVSDKCIERGVAVVEAAYLRNREHKPIRPSLRIAVNRLLTDKDIREIFDVIEAVSIAVL